MAVDPVVLGEDADEWVIATEGGPRGLRRAKVDQHLGIPALQQAGNRWLRRHARVDRAVLNSRDERVAGADCDKVRIGSAVACLAQQRQADRVRARADVGDPKVLPLEVRG